MKPDPLTDVTALAAALADRDPQHRPTVLDVRWDLQQGPRPDLYADGHIPTAVFIDLDTALAAAPGDRRRGRHPLPDPETFCAAMRAGGVRNDRPVVVYDDAGGMIAARAWWLLRHYGHPDVTVLDGSLRAWKAAGHPTESGGPVNAGRDRAKTGGDRANTGGDRANTGGDPTNPGRDPRSAPAARRPVGDFTGEPGHMPTLDADAAAALAASTDGLLIDARAAERFRGDTEPIDPAAGHVPGARNRPTPDNLDDGGHFRDRAALVAAFAALGAEPTSATMDGTAPTAPPARSTPTTVGVYCGSGVTAAHEVLALEIAGIAAALYPGSWSEWSADPTRPVETGDVP